MQRFFGRSGLVALSAIAAILLSPSPGVAAPQALALVATHGGTALTCGDGVCSAEFSAFCLQQDRASPPRGTAYLIEDPATVTVSGVTREGGTVTLDPALILDVQSLRTHVAVRISVDRADLDRLGLRSVAVAIGENATLSPVPAAGDANPQDEIGLAAAAGPLRAVGSRIVDGNEGRMAAARLTSRLINDIDARGVPDAQVTQTLWRRALDGAAHAGADARRMARGALELCQFAVEQRGIGHIKGCLQQHHDKFVDYLNARYWKAVGTGT